MKRLVDLHTHTTASDGQYSPAEVVKKAKAAGIECLAITDHDTVDGIGEAEKMGKALGVTIIRGVELGAKEDRHLHILGLGLQDEPSSLTELCRKLLRGRDERKYRIIGFLEEKGVHIPLEEVEALAGDAAIGRPHFAQIMVKHGYVSSNREAFDKYLDTDDYQKIERFKPTANECIQAISSAGGKSVLAHPYQLGYSDEKLDEVVARLRDMGLDGLECYYPKHTREQVCQYLALAKGYGLHITAGSDFHGERVKPDVAIIPTELEMEWLIGSF